jgi:ribosome-associated protein
MSRRRTESADEEATLDRGPSKSSRKRAAQAAQSLGAHLTELRDADLARLNLPERLLDAVRAARDIRARGGRARQLQYIGKLMRDIDTAPILEALEAPSRARATETEREKRLVHWRDRLTAEGASALAALKAWRPEGDMTEITAKLADARNPLLPESRRQGAKRELLRALRALFASSTLE